MSSNSSKQSRSGGDHGYGYGGYGGSSGYGYGYGGYGYGGYGYGYGSKREGGLQRSLQDYVLILRERIWYIIVVFLVVFSSALIYTLSQTKIYQATATMKVQRHAAVILDKTAQINSQDIYGPEEFGTILSVFGSGAVLNKVADRLTSSGPDLRDFMQPYAPAGGSLGPQDILNDFRKVQQRRGTFIIEVQYRHPNPAIAAKVANYFAEAYVDYTDADKTTGQSKVANDLALRVAEQKKKVVELETAMDNFKKEHNMVSLSQRTDTLRANYMSQASQMKQMENELDRAANYRKQIEQYIQEKRDLTELTFIAGDSAVKSLTGEIASLQIDIKGMEQTYGEKMPEMIKQRTKLSETRQQLTKAVDSAVALVRANEINFSNNLASMKKSMQQAEDEVKNLDALTIQFDGMGRDLNIAAASLQELSVKLASINLDSGLNPNPASILDRAGAPPEDAFVSPNMTVNLSLGVAAGLGLGLVFALFVAYVDDRVKSSFDIESVIGLPLVGIIPQIKKMEQPDKAQIVANNADRQVSEAFLALHSALRLKDESKNGQCILITSTIPGEGKSFVTTNLALTFAAHGERVLIIDCDLRKPNIHRSFRLENLKGLIDVIAGGGAFDDVVVKQLHPNLDILTTGGRAKSPTQVLNSKKFEVLVSDLRKRYDRIFFDTPPLAAVSDALIILPLMDGSLFSIFFNKVRM